MSDSLTLFQLYSQWGLTFFMDDTPRNRFVQHNNPADKRPSYAKAPLLARSAPPHAPAAPPIMAELPTLARQAAHHATSVQELNTVIMNFHHCPLLETATHTVLAQGDGARSGLFIVGEVPDSEEDRSGIVFTGANGALLDQMLSSIDLRREDVALAPVIPWRPPGGRQPTSLEVQTCLPFLHRLISILKPRYLLLLGQTPAHVLLQKTGSMARLRGKWADIRIEGEAQPLSGLALRHPSQLAASPAARRDMWHDLLLLRQKLEA